MFTCVSKRPAPCHWRVDAQLIAESLGLPLLGILPEIRGAAAGTELGRLLELGRRKSVNRFARGVLELNGTIE